MIRLALGICIDFDVVAQSILDDSSVPWLAMALILLFVTLWFILPRALFRRR